MTTARALAALAVALLTLVWWSWGRTLDPLVDFGRELYLPWRITEGRVLYRDLASFNGPLSPYLNALWFTIGGTSLRTLVVANTAITLAIAGLLFLLLRRIASLAAAFAAAAMFVLVFSVSHLTRIGNYNYITPYSHELTHGVLLGLIALWSLARFANDGRWLGLPCAGFTAGLVLLTKPEIAVAVWAGLAATIAAHHRLQRSSLRAAATSAAVFAAAAGLPVLLAAALFASSMPWQAAVKATLTPWFLLFTPEVTRQLAALPFYRYVSGMHDWLGNVAGMAIWTSVFASVVAIAALIPRRLAWLNRRPVPPEAIFIGVAALAVVLKLFAGDRPAQPLPLLLAALTIAAAYSVLIRGRGTSHDAVRLGWLVFATMLLAKIGLSPRLAHYGFALAMPALLTAVVFLLDWLPRRAGQASASAVRAAALALLLIVTLAALKTTSAEFDRKTATVGRGADAFLADERGHAINAAIEAIQQRGDDDRTLVVLPEGVMINYLSRTPSSVPHVNHMPPELIIFSEARIVADLEAEPPRYVALVHKDTTEYGARFFGQDYGRALIAWVERDYHRVDLFGAEPLRDESFGIALFERN
jgi:hypothetical protein